MEAYFLSSTMTMPRVRAKELWEEHFQRDPQDWEWNYSLRRPDSIQKQYWSLCDWQLLWKWANAFGCSELPPQLTHSDSEEKYRQETLLGNTKGALLGYGWNERWKGDPREQSPANSIEGVIKGWRCTTYGTDHLRCCSQQRTSQVVTPSVKTSLFLVPTQQLKKSTPAMNSNPVPNWYSWRWQGSLKLHHAIIVHLPPQTTSFPFFLILTAVLKKNSQEIWLYDSGHTLFHLDWTMLPCSSYSHSFLLNFHSFAVNTLTVKARKRMCWAFSSLCLYLASIQTTLMSSKKKERKFFSIGRVEVGWVEMYSRLSCSPNYWSEHFLPLFLTAQSSTLEKRLETAHRDGTK